MDTHTERDLLRAAAWVAFREDRAGVLAVIDAIEAATDRDGRLLPLSPKGVGPDPDRGHFMAAAIIAAINPAAWTDAVTGTLLFADADTVRAWTVLHGLAGNGAVRACLYALTGMRFGIDGMNVDTVWAHAVIARLCEVAHAEGLPPVGGVL